MVTLAQLKGMVGDEADKLYKYLENKYTGGNNNAKGNNFENYFAIFKIADLWIESAKPDETKFSSQAFCFVDDMVIENPKEFIQVEHYQIKDIKALSWNSIDNPLKDDFKNQYNICSLSGNKPNLYLVVSNSNLKDTLTKNIPNEIEAFTEVVYFPTATSINSLLRNNVDFKNKMKKICALSNPYTSTLETVAATLLGVWDAGNKSQVTLKKIKEDCTRQSPNYLIGATGNVSEDILRILSEIKDFSFEFEHGFLTWRFMDTDEGTVIHCVGTKEYAQWENDILRIGKFNTFEYLESLL